MEKLWGLKQLSFGGAAEFTIEFRRLAGQFGWPDNVLIDILRKGLLDKVREEFIKFTERPKTLFEATNLVIEIDKKCHLESLLRLKHKDTNNKFNRNSNKNKHYSHNSERSHKKRFKPNKHKHNPDVLSANYTPSGKSPIITSTFFIDFKGKKIQTNILIDSGSAKSFLREIKSYYFRIFIINNNSNKIINKQKPF